MNSAAEKICINALSLPRQARIEIAHRLLVSLESEGYREEAEEIKTTWINEATERVKAFDEGKLTERGAADVMRDAYKKAN